MKKKEDSRRPVEHTLGTKVLRAFQVHVQLLSPWRASSPAGTHKPISASHTSAHTVERSRLDTGSNKGENGNLHQLIK